MNSDNKRRLIILGAILALAAAVLFFVSTGWNNDTSSLPESGYSQSSIVNSSQSSSTLPTESAEQSESTTQNESTEQSESTTQSESSVQTESTSQSESTTQDDSTEQSESTSQSESAVQTESTPPESSSESEPAESVPEAPQLRFRNQKLLKQHYEKHGIEMGFSSAEEYEKAAAAVVSHPDVLHKTEAEDGDDVYYIESTNEFVVVSTDGYLRTYFNPDRGIDYFNKQ